MMKSIEEKSSRVLNIILFFFILISIRVWYLTVIKHEEMSQIAKAPQYRSISIPPNRGTIRDRFNIPLAVNRIEYNASIYYDPILHIPRVKFEKNHSGKRIRIYYRKDYISQLSDFLSKNLQVDRIKIEDIIYSKASLFPNTSFIIKENITEEQYYSLKIRERDWPGLHMQIVAKRHYPLGSVASHIIGYIGSINYSEHLNIQNEINELEKFLYDCKIGLPTPLPKGYANKIEVKKRCQELKNKSYTINSKVGKSGVERQFDEELRGFSGKKKIQVDNKGTILRELPESQQPLTGRRLLLTISSELQQYAEQLLTESEIIRENRFSQAGKGHNKIAAPWIKGGAIVAIIPKTGEVVALASYPRFNPNDFVDSLKSNEIIKWLENQNYIGQIWDGIVHLEREFELAQIPYAIVSKKYLTWNAYLDMVLGKESQVKKAIGRINQIKDAIYLQNVIEMLLELSQEGSVQKLIDSIFPPEDGHTLTFHKTDKENRGEIINRISQKTSLLPEIIIELNRCLMGVEKNDDKILVIDLCKIACQNNLFDDKLLTQTGEESLSDYRLFNQATISLQKEIRKTIGQIFHEKEFPKWRAEHFANYLKEKRGEEKNKKKYTKPYIDYLDEIESELFEKFFNENKWEFLISKIMVGYIDPKFDKLKEHLAKMPHDLIIPYLKTMRSFEELTRPLYGKYYLPSKGGKQLLEKDLAKHFYQTPGYGYAKSYAFAENAPLGSIFKLVTGYEALRQHYQKQKNEAIVNLNPFTIVDQSPPYNVKMTNSTILGYTLSGIPIPRCYKGGRLPRGHLNIGRVDLQSALERSSNLYFAMLSSDAIDKPSDLINTAKKLGIGEKTGIDLPGEVKGYIPNDLSYNMTSLFAFAIGQHTLSVTPLQTAMLLTAFANDGKLLKPQIVNKIVNLELTDQQNFLFASNYKHKELLARVGIYFPIFTEMQCKEIKPYIKNNDIQIKDKIFLPNSMRDYLLQGLSNCVNSPYGTARTNAIRTLWENKQIKSIYNQMTPYFIGKTSTAEVIYRPSLERELKPTTCKHIWFGAISFEEPGNFDSADLVVVVFLRFGDHGKEAAPIAAQIIKKWGEIKAFHNANNILN